MTLPTLWESAGEPDLDGVVWFRKNLDLPENFTAAELPALMTYLRTRGIKGHLTLNTLVFGEELEDAQRIIAKFVDHYNQVRLHSAIGYITPADKLAGKEKAIFAARDQKLQQAREQRKLKRNNQPHFLTAQPQFSI